jgi:hypothetical protein
MRKRSSEGSKRCVRQPLGRSLVLGLSLGLPLLGLVACKTCGDCGKHPSLHCEKEVTIHIQKQGITSSPQLLCAKGSAKIVNKCSKPLKLLTITGPDKDTVRRLSPRADEVTGPEQEPDQEFIIEGLIAGCYTITAVGCDNPKLDVKTGTLEVSSNPALPTTK